MAVKRVALAYSGGLDTSVAVPWIAETYDAEVICIAVNVGQSDADLAGIHERAVAAGATGCRVVDVRDAFAEEFILPTLRAGAVYGRKYLLGTAMARPLIAREVVRVARAEGADAVSHGCTGKGNDQVRFELTFDWLAPDLKVIAPWREWNIAGRKDALAYAAEKGVPAPSREASLYSRDHNLWHMSHEGGPLEDPTRAPDEDMFILTADPRTAPAEGEIVTIGFEDGVPVSHAGMRFGLREMLERLNEIGGRHGVGRVDLVEDRIVGLKSRGVYETPGGTLLYAAHSELEQLVLDRRTLDLKDQLAGRYADLVYEGRWWGTEREALDALIDVTQRNVRGSIALHVCRGAVSIAGRSSSTGLYNEEDASFETSGLYEHADAGGFIRLFGLPYRLQGLENLERAQAEDAGDAAAARETAVHGGSDWLD